MATSPRAFDVTPPAEAGPGLGGRPPRAVLIEEEPDAFPPDPVPEEAPPASPARRRGPGFVGIALSALAGFLLLVAGAWAWDAVAGLLARNAVLGWAAAGLAGLGLLAGLAWLARELLALSRRKAIARLRRRAEAVLAAGDAAAAARLAADLVAFYRDRPDTARGRARVEAVAGEIIDARDRLALAEGLILGPLDQRVRAILASSAKRVSVVTAISPRALVDILFVAAESVRLTRRVAELYGGRPGFFGGMRLMGAVLSHLAVTGGVAVGDEVVQQMVGHGLAARLSAKLGEGILNGMLTARVGIAAVAACRPLPFLDLAPPSVKDVAGALWAARDGAGERG